MLFTRQFTAAVRTPCSLPLLQGDGPSSLTRYYLDTTSGLCGQCRPFTYNGLRGNQNNFLTLSQCETSCPRWFNKEKSAQLSSPECPNPCPEGAPALDANGRPQRCAFNRGCSAGSWCHVGADDSTTVCCPNLGRTKSQRKYDRNDL